MKIRPLSEKDRPSLLAMLIKTQSFNSAEIDVAMELVDVFLKNSGQKDYQIFCVPNRQDQVIGYICFGPTPMTQGTFDLYWIVVDPDAQGEGLGSRLLEFLEKKVKDQGGRMILADTSTLPHYKKTRKFYLKNGFREMARIPDYYHPGNDRVTFCKRLSGEG